MMIVINGRDDHSRGSSDKSFYKLTQLLCAFIASDADTSNSNDSNRAYKM